MGTGGFCMGVIMDCERFSSRFFVDEGDSVTTISVVRTLCFGEGTSMRRVKRRV